MPVDSLPRYILPADTLEYGPSLGNAHCWVTTRGSGSVQEVFSTDCGCTIAGTIAVRYASVGVPVLRTEETGLHLDGAQREVALLREDPGSVEIHPAYQRHRFGLPGLLSVAETVFVPLRTGDDPPVVYYMVEIANNGAISRALRTFAYARLGGPPHPNVEAHYDHQLGTLVAIDRDDERRARVLGCTVPVAAYETTTDFGQMYDVLHMTRLRNETTARGDLLGALQVDIHLQPGERTALTFLLAFAPTGETEARKVFTAAHDVDTALHETVQYITQAAQRTRVLTPEQALNNGVLWSKVNMLRIMARYPVGPAFTNEPGVSSNVVLRDAIWFIYGNDHFLPSFSESLLESIAAQQYPDGKLPEYFNAMDGHREDYGLNINDGTPLFVLAVNHHFRATGDLQWLERLYPTVTAAATYILSQEDERGLVFCSARDPRGNVWAIAGWRNVIPDYQLNGAVTEINAECVAALRAASHLAGNLHRAEDAATFQQAGAALQKAMDRHLLNKRNGLYLLNLDADGVAHTDVTGDLVFPVIFRACSRETGFRIVKRLFLPDFWSRAGLRTTSLDDPLFDPSKAVGLLGGVWSGLSWWYAFAAARYHPEIMVEVLVTCFEHFSAAPKANNTVPGQFCEWFDGMSLVNRGMRLSPWDPPRFLWAAVEGVCGIVLQPEKAKVQPLVPEHWRWLGLRRLAYHGAELSFFATRGERGATFEVYTSAEALSAHRLHVYEEDATDQVQVNDPDICCLALRRTDEIVVLLGHTGSDTRIVGVDLEGLLRDTAHYVVHMKGSEQGTWKTEDAGSGAAFRTFAVTIEAHGYRVLTFVQQ